MKSSKPFKYGMIFIVPSLLLYLFLQYIYTHSYSIQTQFSLRNNKESISIDSGAGLLGTGQGGDSQDLFLIKEYILSPDLFTLLDRELKLGEAYRSRAIWFGQRAPETSSHQAYLGRYRDAISVKVDTEASILTVTFTGHDAKLLLLQAQKTLEYCENFTNQVSRNIALRQTAGAKEHLSNSYETLQANNKKLTSFQKNNQVFAPDSDAGSVSGIITQLEGRLAEKKAEKNAYSHFYSQNSSQLLTIDQHIKSLEQQIQAEKQRLIQPVRNDAPPLNELAADYQFLKVERDMAVSGYSTALQTVQQMHISAADNLKSLVLISAPFEPEKPTYPRIWLWLLALLPLQIWAVQNVKFPKPAGPAAAAAGRAARK